MVSKLRCRGREDCSLIDAMSVFKLRVITGVQRTPGDLEQSRVFQRTPCRTSQMCMGARGPFEGP